MDKYPENTIFSLETFPEQKLYHYLSHSEGQGRGAYYHGEIFTEQFLKIEESAKQHKQQIVIIHDRGKI